MLTYLDRQVDVRVLHVAVGVGVGVAGLVALAGTARGRARSASRARRACRVVRPARLRTRRTAGGTGWAARRRRASCSRSRCWPRSCPGASAGPAGRWRRCPGRQTCQPDPLSHRVTPTPFLQRQFSSDRDTAFAAARPTRLCIIAFFAWSVISCSIERLLPSWNRMPRVGVLHLGLRCRRSRPSPGGASRRSLDAVAEHRLELLQRQVLLPVAGRARR